MSDDALEHLLAEHRLDGPGADLRARALARAEAAWRDSDGYSLGLALWGFARRWGLCVAAALVLNLAVDRLGPGAGTEAPAVTSAVASSEWRTLCYELDLPEALCLWLRSLPTAPAMPAAEVPEWRELERGLDRAG